MYLSKEVHPVGQVLSNMVCNRGSDNPERRSGDVSDWLSESSGPTAPYSASAFGVF